MRALLSLITVAACFLHLGLDCGAHHGHEFGGSHGSIPISLNSQAADLGHSLGPHHTPADSEAPSHPEGSHDDGHEGHCNLLMTGTTRVLVQDTQVAALPPVFLDAVVAQTATVSVNWMRDTGDYLQLPVRLHLLHQILLI